MKRYLIPTLCIAMLGTGCSTKKQELNTFSNITLDLGTENVKYTRYTTEKEFKQAYDDIVATLNSLTFNTQQDFYTLKQQAISYVDSYIAVYKTLDGAFAINTLIEEKFKNIDTDADGVKDYLEVFVAGTSPLRKITNERKSKDDGTVQNVVSVYIIDGKITPIIFGDVIKSHMYKSYTPPDNYIYFDLLLRSNTLQSLAIKPIQTKVKNQYPIGFRIEGVYSPKVRGTATFYHHNRPAPETNYVVYNNTEDNYLERGAEYTRTVSELFTNTDYVLVF